jgi:small subunit ribosomal protein S18
MTVLQNMSMISEHITKMGRIRHSRDTGLRPVNQRRMAKAVRRAIGMGLHPSIHKHPELLRNDPTQQRAAGFAPTGSMTRL